MVELKTESEIMDLALRLLARRDYSESELRIKLKAKSDHVSGIENVISRLKEMNYQNDDRYTASYIRYAQGQGKGPGWIKAKMHQKGVSKPLVNQCLAASDIDWQQVANDQLGRKFKGPADDPKENGRRFRFLASRGFSPDTIRKAMETIGPIAH